MAICVVVNSILNRSFHGLPHVRGDMELLRRAHKYNLKLPNPVKVSPLQSTKQTNKGCVTTTFDLLFR